MGDWLKKYGEAIYSTRPCPPYKEDNTFLTQTEACIYAVVKGAVSSIPLSAEDRKGRVPEQCLRYCVYPDVKEVMLTNLVETDEEYTVSKLYKQL